MPMCLIVARYKAGSPVVPPAPSRKAFDFEDPGQEVVADFGQAGALGKVGAEHGAVDAGVFVDACGAERAGADADGELAAFEVSEEGVPFLSTGSPTTPTSDGTDMRLPENVITHP
jgi:hypothetical protein